MYTKYFIDHNLGVNLKYDSGVIAYEFYFIPDREQPNVGKSLHRKVDAETVPTAAHLVIFLNEERAKAVDLFHEIYNKGT